VERPRDQGGTLIALVTLAAAAPVRLILVGDTGEDTEIGRRVAQAIAQEAADPTVRVLAMGDLFYDSPPVGPDCVEQVAARYQLFYGGVPGAQMVGVIGNHDVGTADVSAFSAEARACTVAAFAKLGWASPDSHLLKLDRDGVKIDLAVVDAGYMNPDGTHSGATPPVLPFRKGAHWRLLTDHYTWLSSTGKCAEAGNTWSWLGKPDLDLWLNGHAHHMEAIPVGGALAVTSGAGKEFRDFKQCEGVSGSFFVYTKTERALGGYVRLDIESKTTATVTPVLCEVGGACVDEPAVVCTREKSGRGVTCAAAPKAP
jgi:hypothetical protein